MKLKARHKLIPAVAMLAVSAIVLGSASFAWFTMSKTVTATGINLTAVAPTNLLIAQAKDDKGAAPVDADYGETVALTALSGRLKPASTLNGVDFFKVDKGLGTNGIPKEGNTIEAATGALKWTATQAIDGYYADYDLWLKTTGDTPVNVMVDPKVTAITGTDPQTLKDSVRFAVLDNSTGTPAAFTDKKNYIWNNKRTAEFATPVVGPISAAGTGAEDYKGTVDANLIKNSTTLTDNTIFTVAKATPTKITVRVWIEGQAAACINTNAAQSFKLTVAFTEAATVPVTP